jgi:hypothetical protein
LLISINNFPKEMGKEVHQSPPRHHLALFKS